MSLYVLLATYWSPARVLGLWIIGRTSICTLRDSLDCADRGERRENAMRRLAQTGKVVQTDENGRLQLWDTKQGQFWLASEAMMHGFWAVLAEQEVNLHGTGGLGVRAGNIVLDCGANYGTFTREALRAGASLVVAIEPSPTTVACLRKTFANEIRDGRVIVYPKGVWDREDKLVLHSTREQAWLNSFVETDHGTDGPVVPLTTIDHLVSELSLKRVDVIKLDIEGAERRALAGASRTLTAYKPRVLASVNHLPDDPEALPKAVRQVVPAYNVQCHCQDWGFEIRPELAILHTE